MIWKQTRLSASLDPMKEILEGVSTRVIQFQCRVPLLMSCYSIASKTQALLTFNPATLIVSIGGELGRVRSAHHDFKRQRDVIKERGAFHEDNFTLLSMDFGDGLKFVPGKDHNTWNIHPVKLDGIFGLGDGSQAHSVEEVAMILLKKLSYLALSKDHGLKMNVRCPSQCSFLLLTSFFSLPWEKQRLQNLIHPISLWKVQCSHQDN